MIKYLYRTFVLFCMLSLLSTAPSLAADTTFEKPAFNSGKVTMTFADSPLKTMTETPFFIAIVGEDGQTISDAELSIDMDMPAMPMPPNNPKAAWQGDSYQGTAIFTMAGAWRITVKIQRPEHNQEQVVFNIEQVMMK